MRDRQVRLRDNGISPSAAGLRTRTDLPPVAANDAKAKARQAAAGTVACRERECHVKTRACVHARRRDVTVQPRYREGEGCGPLCGRMLRMCVGDSEALGRSVGATVPGA